jgi:hypothetical protein
MDIDRYFQIHGISVGVSGNRWEILEEAAQELRFFEGSADPAPRIRVSAIEQEALGGPPGGALEQRPLPGDEIHWIDETIVSVLNVPNRSVQLHVTPDAPADAAVVVLFGVIGFLVHLDLSQKGDVAAFHGAALHKDGQAILLLGKTNSGKTSLSYLLNTSGYAYLSEEDSWIQHAGENRFRVLPYPRRIRITEAVMKERPELNRLPHEKRLVESLHERVFRIDPRQPFPTEARLRRVVYLDNRQDAAALSVQPMTKAEALPALLASLEGATVHDSPESAQEALIVRNRTAFSMANSIVDSLNVTCVTYNIIRDFPDLPAVINHIVETV